MTQDFDIVIAGGGLNGPTLALALAQAGLRVAVVDPQPARARAGAGFDGMAAINGTSEARVILGNPELESYQISAAFLFKVGHRNHHGLFLLDRSSRGIE